MRTNHRAYFGFIIILLLGHKLSGAQSQTVSMTPATILAGIGTPSANGFACNVGVASSTSTSLYDQRDLATGNSVWKCKLLSDGVTYSWVAPFTAPAAIINSTAIPATSITSFGCGSIGPVTVTGAQVGMGVFASVIGATSVSQITSLIPSGLVTSTNTVMLAYCNYSLSLLTPVSGLSIRFTVQ